MTTVASTVTKQTFTYHSSSLLPGGATRKVSKSQCVPIYGLQQKQREPLLSLLLVPHGRVSLPPLLRVHCLFISMKFKNRWYLRQALWRGKLKMSLGDVWDFLLWLSSLQRNTYVVRVRESVSDSPSYLNSKTFVWPTYMATLNSLLWRWQKYIESTWTYFRSPQWDSLTRMKPYGEG